MEGVPSSLSLVLLAAALAGPALAGPAIPAAVLAPAEEALRSACGCDSFMVRWTIPEAVAAGASSLDSLAAVPEAGRTMAGRSAVDKVTVHLRGLRGGMMQEYLVEAEPLCHGTALTVREMVRAGTVLSTGDVAAVDGWFAPSVLRDLPDAVEGKAARCTLVPGRALHGSDLTEPALVQRGATVRLLLHLGGISIEGRGVARQDGRRGERIGVRLAGAAKDCAGEVTGPGEVLVAGEGGGS